MSDTSEQVERYVKSEFADKLVGRKITSVRAMTAAELDLYGWDPGYRSTGLVVMLDNGQAIVPSQDPEGNGPGHLFIEDTEATFADGRPMR